MNLIPAPANDFNVMSLSFPEDKREESFVLGHEGINTLRDRAFASLGEIGQKLEEIQQKPVISKAAPEASHLLQLLLEEEQLLEMELRSLEDIFEIEACDAAIQKIEASIEAIAAEYPNASLNNFDDGYRLRNSAHIMRSLKRQLEASGWQGKCKDDQEQTKENKSQILKSTPEAGESRKRAATPIPELAEKKYHWELSEATKEVICQYLEKKKDNLGYYDQTAYANRAGISEFKQLGGHEVGISSRIGARKTMEDTHIATEIEVYIAGRPYAVQIIGIFDGHGGTYVADMLKKSIESKVARGLIKFNRQGLHHEGIWKALKWSCVSFNKEIKNDPMAQKAGSTSTLAMILDGNLWTSNVGDSSIILVTPKDHMQLTEEASPIDQKYLKGIKKRGGVIFLGRIDGILAAGKAFGDHGLNGHVSGSPNITVIPFNKESLEYSFLLLACDGIRERGTMTRPADLAELLRATSAQSVELMANHVTENAYRLDSSDNLTAIVMKFKFLT